MTTDLLQSITLLLLAITSIVTAFTIGALRRRIEALETRARP